MSSTEELIGRSEVDDIEAILAVSNTDVDEVIHAVRANADAVFTWDYEQSRKPLQKLYEKAKTSQWNSNDLPWDTEVDQEKVALENQAQNGWGEDGRVDVVGTPFEHWGDKEWLAYGIEAQNWTLSQFMHGEQGALICTAQIVETVPWIDAKYYASTQVMDEARHVEVFGRYLSEKLSGNYPIQLLRYVMSDEARHVAFGVLSLKEYYAELSAPEIRERQEFAFEAAVRMRDRFLQQEVWERMGIDVKAAVQVAMQDPDRPIFQAMLFSKIVPNCKKLGLLDAADGWLRDRFTELGVIQFEDWADTGEEYAQLDEVAKDRSAVTA